MYQIEQDISKHGKLRSGRFVLNNVPIFENVIEIGAPARRPLFTLDLNIEPDLIDIRRTDDKKFNVAHYRSAEGESGPLLPHLMLVRPVELVRLQQKESDICLIEGPGLEVVDRITALAFVDKIIEVAYLEQKSGTVTSS